MILSRCLFVNSVSQSEDSGVSMTIPELELPSNITDIDYEIHFYNFARQCYNTIIGNEQMFAPIPSGFTQQLSLLDS